MTFQITQDPVAVLLWNFSSPAAPLKRYRKLLNKQAACFFFFDGLPFCFASFVKTQHLLTRQRALAFRFRSITTLHKLKGLNAAKASGS